MSAPTFPATMTAPLGIPEVAAMTGVPDATLRYWRHVGTGPRSYKIGRRVRYDLADVVAWLDEQRSATQVGGLA